MAGNQELLRKADMTLAELQSNGGEMQPEEGASFIRKLMVQPSLIRDCRVVEMMASSRRINKIGLGSRILRKATQGTALTQNQRSKVTTEQITLNTTEQIAEVRIPYDVMEDNIERASAANNEASNTGPGALRQTILDLIAERAVIDLEELALKADTAYVNGGDADDQAYLSQFDGWLKKAETGGNVVDANNATVTKTIFKNGIKVLPKQYLRNRGLMNHYVSNNNEVEYRDTLSNRATSLGDANTTGETIAYAYGVKVSPVQQMPEDEGLFTDPKNLIFGIQRQVSLEFDKEITTRVYIIVLTCRVAVEIEEAEAVVYYQNIAE